MLHVAGKYKRIIRNWSFAVHPLGGSLQHFLDNLAGQERGKGQVRGEEDKKKITGKERW